VLDRDRAVPQGVEDALPVLAVPLGPVRVGVVQFDPDRLGATDEFERRDVRASRASVQAVLESADVRAENARGQQPGTERARRVGAERGEATEGRPDRAARVLELPEDLGRTGAGVVQLGGLRGVGGGAQRVRAHVRDAGRLPGRPRCGLRGGGGHHLRGPVGDEASADLPGRVELAGREGPCPRDGVTRTVVVGRLRLEEWQDPFGAIGGPGGDEAAVGFGE
jgi:hypothetical protein